MTRYYPAEDVPRKLWAMAGNPAIGTWENCGPAPLSGPCWPSSLGATEATGWFSWGSWAGPCFLWVDLCPLIEFLCTEHTRNLSSPPLPKSISVVWKSPNISRMLTSRSSSYTSPCWWARWDLWHKERERRDYRPAQGRSESRGLANAAKNQSCPSAAGLPPLCVCSHKWPLSSQNEVPNFLWRT